MLAISVSQEQGLVIRAGKLCLSGVQPVINGPALAEVEMSFQPDEPARLRWQPPDLSGTVFEIEVDGRVGSEDLVYRLSGLPAGFRLDSFGLAFQSVAGMRSYLRSGYHSWDGAYYVQPGSLPGEYSERADLETGYALTQLLPWQAGQPVLTLGFERHDRFQQSFRFDTRQQPPSLTIVTCWDQKGWNGGGPVSESLRLFESAQAEDGLRAWAAAAAAAANPAPRLEGPPITGWCSWYNLYAAISEENILAHLRSARTEAVQNDLPMRVFQIDDGFTPEMGDWLDVKPQFPRGVKPVLDEIRAAGFKPGLWIAPFLVGNRSRLYQTHPDWVVRDRATEGPLVLMRFYGEFRWHKRSEEYYLLDGTHPDALEYLRLVFRTWARDWGCEYFKTDFMYYGAAYGPDRAVFYQPGLTRVGIWRQVASLIRAEIGEALWMGCGCPLWAGVGLVDAVRVGRDVGVTWGGSQSAQSLLRDTATRAFANHILWQADPDSVLLRGQFHSLDDNELEALAIYAGMTGGVMTTSDDLGALSEERLALWKLILPERKQAGRFPLLGQSELVYETQPDRPDTLTTRPADGLLVQERPSAGGSALFFFNTGDIPLDRTLPLASLGLPVRGWVWERGSLAGSPAPLDALRVVLAPHSGRLFWVTRKPLDREPVRL